MIGKAIDKVKHGFVGYDKVTENKRFERGVIENISDVSDLMFPAHGNTLQKKQHLIHRIRKTAREIIDLGKRKIFMNVDEDYIANLEETAYEHRLESIKDEKADQLGVVNERQLIENTKKSYPIDLFMWYGKYEKNGKKEEYRFIVEPITNNSKYCQG